ncbi:hypothetical protein HOLleu_00812 [Holothuria leucospilota]|uniref:Uncharacterized protein n=1 Tax=Holothuria leucospilota TaxID=206669 RepID=A0A9Q1HJW8_HOLLE|nr:hypothetical protein HOLleu_00812 [Holothuria leucospilota]
MALLQQIKYSGITFGVLPDQILRMLLFFARSNGSKFVHFVRDRYMNNSIKNAERVKRGSCGVELIKIYADEQSVPKQWKKFLSGGSNKEALIEYLFKKWSNESNTLGDVTIFVAHGPVCHKLFQSPGSSNVSVEEVNALHCNHEEADTRMFLHCAYGWVMSENELSIDWMDLPPAPSSILEYVQCSCKKIEVSPKDMLVYPEWLAMHRPLQV